MNKKEIEKRRAGFEARRKEIAEKLEKRSISNDDAKKEIDKLKHEVRSFEQEVANYNRPDTDETRKAFDFSEVRSAMMEQRAITIGADLGGQAFVSSILEEMKSKSPLLGAVSTYVGANSRTTIPVLLPGLAEPAGAEEGATSTSSDSKASLNAVELLPFPFVSTLPVSLNTIKLGAVNFEKELPKLFADAFKQCFHKQIFNGTGSKQFTGFSKHSFSSEKTVNAKTASKLTVTDLSSLALEVADRTDSGCILMHPSIYTKILEDSPKADLSAVYIRSLTESKTIEGVKIILTTHMLKDTTAGKVVAIAGEMSKYGIAIAGDITITPKAKVGDINVYYEAVMFANGQPLIDDFWALKAK